MDRSSGAWFLASGGQKALALFAMSSGGSSGGGSVEGNPGRGMVGDMLFEGRRAWWL